MENIKNKYQDEELINASHRFFWLIKNIDRRRH